MAELAQLESALVKADAAGNTEDARALAAEILRMRSAQPAQPAQPEQSFADRAKGVAGDVLAGAARGASGIGSTLLEAAKYTNPVSALREAMAGPAPLQNIGQRTQAVESTLSGMGADTSSLPYQAGKIGTEIAGTLGVGGAIAKPIAGVAPRIATAIQSGGMSVGPRQSLIRDMATRILGGGITGGASAGLVNPEQAGTGAAIGAALPPAISGAGAVGGAIGRAIRGPQVAPQVQQAVSSAREAGYVIPPTQANPTLANRVLEGLSGKITTAQNASARNQPITNELARKAIGAADLSPEGIQAVRASANAAYDELAQVGAFQADDAYREALRKAAGSKALPGIVNKEVDELVDVLSQQGQLDAQQTIESIKRLRFEGSANKSAQDPTKRALGSAQMKISAALEDLIDRNLKGSPELLQNYRAARQTLAKTYDVEKALNQASGNVDAAKLARQLQKGRPLTGELRQVAEFAQQFPKAAQSVERMGSLPQVSPLDFGAMGALSAATSNPLMMAGIAARPAARGLALSPLIQNRLVQSNRTNTMAELLSSPEGQRLLYGSAPVVSAQ